MLAVGRVLCGSGNHRANHRSPVSLKNFLPDTPNFDNRHSQLHAMQRSANFQIAHREGSVLHNSDIGLGHERVRYVGK